MFEYILVHMNGTEHAMFLAHDVWNPSRTNAWVRKVNSRRGKRRQRMSRFVEGEDRSQVALLPECLDDFVAEDNPVRVIDAFVSELNLEALGFDGLTPASTGRP